MRGWGSYKKDYLWNIVGNGRRVIKCRQWVSGVEKLPDRWREVLDGNERKRELQYTEVMRSRSWGWYNCPRCKKEI
jgi:hypothetical protein